MNPSIVDSISTKSIRAIEKQYASIKKLLTRSTEKTLKRLKRKEEKLKRKLAQKDSTAANSLFAAGDDPYKRLQQNLRDPQQQVSQSLKNYVPGIDSVQTMLSWMNQPGGLSSIAGDKLKQLQSASTEVASLQAQLQAATDVKEFIKQRKAQLQSEFDKLGLTKELAAFKKEAYYYQQQLSEYKQVLSDPDKLIQKALSIARNTAAFKDFFSRNSILAQLFPMPNGYGTAQALQGLQTRTGVQQQLTQQLGSAGVNPQQYMQQQLSQAQSQLTALKDKINKAGGGDSEFEVPDFKPNTQHTKSFLKRIEYGFNIQSQKTNSLLPVTSDMAITAGYKLNDKSVIGIGAGYKLGWGKDISHIKISSEGVSLRSYLDIKLKGSIWISGGYEYNYQQSFNSIEQLKNLNAWQKSGLIGLTKKYKMGKRNGNLQLLWDFLSYSQVPKTQALKFRIGYTL